MDNNSVGFVEFFSNWRKGNKNNGSTFLFFDFEKTLHTLHYYF